MQPKLIHPGWAWRWSRRAMQHIKDAPRVFFLMCALMICAEILLDALPSILGYVYGLFVTMLGASIWVQAHRGIRGFRAAFLALIAHTKWRAWVSGLPGAVIGYTVAFGAFELVLGGLQLAMHQPPNPAALDNVGSLPTIAVSNFVSASTFVILSKFVGGLGVEAISASACASNPDWRWTPADIRASARVATRANATIIFQVTLMSAVATFVLSTFALDVLPAMSGEDWHPLILFVLLYAAPVGFSVVFMWEGVCEMLDIDPPRTPAPKKVVEATRQIPVGGRA